MEVKGVNFTEIFSAAAKMVSVCIVPGNAAEKGWEIHHVNIKSAHLNVPFKEMVYMKPPHGILKHGEEGKLFHLLKVLYSLTQASRVWHQELVYLSQT